MLLITYEDTVVFDNKQGVRERTPMVGHILTHLSLPSVIAYLARSVEENCQQFQAVGMNGWFTIVQVTDVHKVYLKQIHAMQSKHFSGFYLTNNLERFSFDQVTQPMLDRPSTWKSAKDESQEVQAGGADQ